MFYVTLTLKTFVWLDHLVLIVSVVKSLTDVCNAVGTDLCGNKYMCVNNTCVFKCEFFTCNQHGQCFLETVNEVPTPLCR